jgi:hypothetical protein
MLAAHQHPGTLRGRARWQGSHCCRATRYLSWLTTLVSRVAAPPVLSRDLHSRIRCVSRVTSARRFATIADRSTDDEETGPAWIDPLPSERAGSTPARVNSLSHRKPAVIRARPQIRNAIHVVKERSSYRENEKAPVGEPTGALCPSGRSAVCAFRSNVREASACVVLAAHCNRLVRRTTRCDASAHHAWERNAPRRAYAFSVAHRLRVSFQHGPRSLAPQDKESSGAPRPAPAFAKLNKRPHEPGAARSPRSGDA